MPKKFKVELVSWEAVYDLSRQLSGKLVEAGYVPDIVIGLARGGWVPARNLCDFMGVKDLVSLKTEHWGITATPDGEAVLKYPFKIDLKGKKVLIVDDITDTGKSMQLSVDYIGGLEPGELKTATLHHIKGCEFNPDFSAEEIGWRWMLYPWCFTEDLINLAKNLMEEEEKMHLEAVKKGLEDTYEIDVSLGELEKILKEMERRDVIEKLEEDPGHWRCKVSKEAEGETGGGGPGGEE